MIKQKPQPLSVIIPIFKGFEDTRNCLQSVVEGLEKLEYSVLLINDCSPEADIVELCREFSRREHVDLIENPANLGFVKSINIGFNHTSDQDVIILNSDTVVCQGWAKRLNAVAYQDESISTVTPFSNNATICSYPIIGEWVEGYSADFTNYLGNLFYQENGLQWEEIPTAVGFCMYIKRSAIELVGGFDEDAFGKGYGEECDFCLRLEEKNFKSVIATGVFVHHQGGVSFGESAAERKQAAEKVIRDRYPNYSSKVEAFIAKDPLIEYREKVTLAVARDFPVAGGVLLSYGAAFKASQVNLRKSQLSANSIAESLKEANAEYKNVCAQLSQAQTLLLEARESFSEADASLFEAQKSAEKNRRDMDSLSEEHNTLSLQFSEASKENLRLQQHLALIEGSRAWRLIQWIKNILGKQ